MVSLPGSVSGRTSVQRIELGAREDADGGAAMRTCPDTDAKHHALHTTERHHLLCVRQIRVPSARRLACALLCRYGGRCCGLYGMRQQSDGDQCSTIGVSGCGLFSASKVYTLGERGATGGGAAAMAGAVSKVRGLAAEARLCGDTPGAGSMWASRMKVDAASVSLSTPVPPVR